MNNSFLNYCNRIFGVTPYQESEARFFMEPHNKECPKTSEKVRSPVSNDEQATVQATYGFSFVSNGIGDNVKVFCTFCGEDKNLPMSDYEMSMFPA